MHLLVSALPEFLGSITATLLMAFFRWVSHRFRARTTPLASRCTGGAEHKDAEARPCIPAGVGDKNDVPLPTRSAPGPQRGSLDFG